MVTGWLTYQVVALAAVHQAVHDGDDLEPEVQQIVRLREHDEVV